MFSLSRIYGGHEYSLLTVVLEAVGMHWMATVFLLAIGAFIADLVCGFGFLFPKAKMHIRALGPRAGLAARGQTG